MLQWILAMQLENRRENNYIRLVIIRKIAKLKVNVLIVASLDIMPAIAAVPNHSPTSRDIIILCKKKLPLIQIQYYQSVKSTVPKPINQTSVCLHSWV